MHDIDKPVRERKAISNIAIGDEKQEPKGAAWA
jgi:hypothetical protein